MIAAFCEFIGAVTLGAGVSYDCRQGFKLTQIPLVCEDPDPALCRCQTRLFARSPTLMIQGAGSAAVLLQLVAMSICSCLVSTAMSC